MQEKRLNCTTDENLNVLREVVKSLPRFDKMICARRLCSKELATEDGSVNSWCLMHVPEISVSRNIAAEGSTFPQRSHSEKEWIICYTGKVQIIYDDGVKTLTRGGYVYHKSGVRHSLEFLEDTALVTITIPASLDFPHG